MEFWILIFLGILLGIVVIVAAILNIHLLEQEIVELEGWIL